MSSAIVSRHLAFRFLRTCAQVLTILAFAAFLIDFVEFTRRSGGLANYSFGAAMELSALKLPAMLDAILPFAVLFASAILLSAASARSELVVLRSLGLSVFQILQPLGFVSLLIGVASIAALSPLGISGLAKARLLEADMAGAQIRPDAGNPRLWLEQRDENGLVVIGARENRQGGQELLEATLLRFSPSGDLVERVDAPRAELINQTWVFQDATRLLMSDGISRDVAAYSAASHLTLEDIREGVRRPESTSIYEIFRALRVARRAGKGAAALATKLSGYLATPFLFVGMCWVAAPLALQSHRSGGAGGLVLSTLAIGFAIYVLSSVARSLGAAAVINAAAAGFLPAAIALAAGCVWLVLREEI